MKKYYYLYLLLAITVYSCSNAQPNTTLVTTSSSADSVINSIAVDTAYKTIHIFVALCDNKYQGIVPVPAKIGNGQDPANNLYWGCGFGISTYFKNSKEWKLVRKQTIDSLLLERLIFKHSTKNFYLIADAYNGKYIEQCTKDFLKSSAGQRKDTVMINDRTIGIAGHAKLVAYIGHDGLMDFQLPESYINSDNRKRDIIILACYSKHYFAPHVKQANVSISMDYRIDGAGSLYDTRCDSWLCQQGNKRTDKNQSCYGLRQISKMQPESCQKSVSNWVVMCKQII